MAGTIVVDRIESDASYASNINVASQITFSNTVNFGITSVVPVAGFYSPSTNNVAFTTASTERVRVTSAGNVGFGVTPVTMTSSTGLQVSTQTIVQQVVSNQAMIAANAYYNGAWKVVATQTGYAAVRLNAASAGAVSFHTSSSSLTADASLANMDGSDIKMIVDASGQLILKRTSVVNAATIVCGGAQNTRAVSFVNNNNNNEVGYIFLLNDGTSTQYASSSDYRLKENIVPMTGALAKVAQLKPVTYKWKINGLDGQGFIAHELQEVVPDCVTGVKNATHEQEYEVTPAVKDQQGNITTPAVMGTRTVPEYQGVDTSFLVATLTAAIQELKAINDTQAATITALTARIVALES